MPVAPDGSQTRELPALTATDRAFPADKHFDKLGVDSAIPVLDSDRGGSHGRILEYEIAEVPAPFGHNQGS